MSIDRPCERDRSYAGRVHPRTPAAAQHLRIAAAQVGRRRHGPLLLGHRPTGRQAGHDRSLIRRPDRADCGGRGTVAVSVAISPAPFRCALPLLKVDTENAERGPLLIISREKDHTVPWAIVNASYKKQQRNEGVTEIVEIPGRGHALAIDNGWRAVAGTAVSTVAGGQERLAAGLVHRPSRRPGAPRARARGNTSRVGSYLRSPHRRERRHRPQAREAAHHSQRTSRAAGRPTDRGVIPAIVPVIPVASLRETSTCREK
jgi:hypothetical protein